MQTNKNDSRSQNKPPKSFLSEKSGGVRFPTPQLEGSASKNALPINSLGEKQCPYCAETIKSEAIVCRFCGRELNSPVANKHQSSSGAQTLGTISVICGVLGLLVFGIPLGIIALACGIPALSMGASNAKTGVVLGIIDITLAIGILAFSSGF